VGFPLAVDFGREITSDLAAAEPREWLVANGLGGFASGTVAGSLTRRYHGLLIAALEPPRRRTLLVAKLDETAEYDGELFSLSTNRWRSGVVDPQGYRHIKRFRLEGTTPVWTFACAAARVQKRIWMQPGANTTYIQYTYLHGSRALLLTLKALVNYRDYHSLARAEDRRLDVQPVEHGLRIVGGADGTPFYLLSATARTEPTHEWWYNFDLAAERRRGFGNSEDHLHAGTFSAQLAPGDSLTLVASTDPTPILDGQAAWKARRAYERQLLDCWARAFPRGASQAPAWLRQLVLAADQFIVRRPREGGADAYSVIAGYPWFGEWGRDAMISLPGLMLATGRAQIACNVLRTWARSVDCGMLPNGLSERDGVPDYNSADATLWFFEALRRYHATTKDHKLLRELFPLLAEIIAWHRCGTRHGIHVDPADGLLYAGEPGVSLTWMDAKADDWAVTPRLGKPVEVNALWYNALRTMARFARTLHKPTATYDALARQARAGFQRFWNEATGYCFDVIDGPEGNDASLRPNQIFAVALPETPLTRDQQRAVVDVCARRLLTPFGLRSLAPDHPDYRGHYQGGPCERDAAYHQGTIWGWLLGPFVTAHLRVYKDPKRARSFLESFAQHLQIHGLGTASEIFDGDPPFTPQGCIAQAWTVAEILRAWHAAATFRKRA
jgi:predicted glycogen debranching enzyme